MMKNAPLPGLSILWSWGAVVWILLIVSLIASAIAVVWVKHQVRLTSKQDYALRVEEGRLQLEYNHLLSRTRIEQIARNKLGMSPIGPAQERVLLLPEGSVQP
jgi:cell division protein FtsL